MFDLILATILIADVPEGLQPRPSVPNTGVGACANQDVGPNSEDVNGVCVYEVAGYGWYFLTADGNEGPFPTKQAAIEASKK